MVSWTACSSLCTVSFSLLTAALAEARFASRVAVLIVAFAAVDPALDSLLSRSRAVVVLGVVLVGEVVVLVVPVAGVVLGVVVVVGAVLFGVVLVGVVLAGVVAAGVVLAGVVVVPVGTT